MAALCGGPHVAISLSCYGPLTAKGTYTKAHVCTALPAGAKRSAGGDSFLCPAGSVQSKKRDSCAKCPPNEIAASAGLSACTRCTPRMANDERTACQCNGNSHELKSKLLLTVCEYDTITGADAGAGGAAVGSGGGGAAAAAAAASAGSR